MCHVVFKISFEENDTFEKRTISLLLFVKIARAFFLRNFATSEKNKSESENQRIKLGLSLQFSFDFPLIQELIFRKEMKRK